MMTTPDHTTPPTSSTALPQGRQVSITEAARLLGVSGETIRRRIHAGELEAVRAVRPRGAWRVVLPSAPPVVELGGQTAPHGEHDQEPAPSTGVDAGSSTGVAGVEPASDLGPVVATLGAALAGLVGQVEAARVDVVEAHRAAEQRSGELADLREERGRLTAELKRAASALVAAEGALAASDEALVAERRHARFLGLALAVLAILTLMAGAVAVVGWVLWAG